MESPEEGEDFVPVDLKTPRDITLKHCDDVGIFKVLVIGDPGVGKTSFIRRYVHDAFSLETRASIGLDFKEHTFYWDAKTEVRLHFWDVPGQERFIDQTNIFYRDTRALIVLYDATKTATMSKARLWKREADSRCTLNGRPYNPPAILLANKIDLLCNKSEDYDTTMLDIVMREESFKAGFPISNLGNYNIAQSIRKLVEILLIENKRLYDCGFISNRGEEPIDLTDWKEVDDTKKKCSC